MKNIKKEFGQVICAGKVLGVAKTEKGFCVTLGDGKDKASFFFNDNDRIKWSERMPKLKIKDGTYIAIVGAEASNGNYFGNEVLFPNRTASFYNKEKKEVGSIAYFGRVGKKEVKDDGKVRLSLPVSKSATETEWLNCTFKDDDKVKNATNCDKFVNQGDLVLIIGSTINEQYHSTFGKSFTLIKRKETAAESEQMETPAMV